MARSKLKSEDHMPFALPSKLRDVPRDVVDLNYLIICYLRHGFSTAAIAEWLGLTHSQIQYRVRMYHLQGERWRFRNGKTEYAKRVLELAVKVPKAVKDREIEKFSAIRQSILDAFKRKEL